MQSYFWTRHVDIKDECKHSSTDYQPLKQMEVSETLTAVANVKQTQSDIYIYIYIYICIYIYHLLKHSKACILTMQCIYIFHMYLGPS